MNQTTPAAESILARAVEIAAVTDREAFFKRACGADPALRNRVGRLVADYLAAGAFLEPRSPTATAAHPTGAAAVGAVVGPYKLLASIGEGGMGLVFAADQTSPVRRRVAVKVVKPGMDTKAVLARFEAERRALALMDHPNITKVLDAGATPDGRPYFVMELVQGVPITDFCDARKLAPASGWSCSSPSARPCSTPTRRGSSTATSSPRTSWSPCTTARPSRR